MILSILVPFVEQHRECFNELCKALVKQYSGTDVEMVYDDDEYASTGEKRNRLLNKASGK